MKFLFFVATLALAVAATHAAPCTVAEMDKASTNPELLAANAKCYVLKTNAPSTTSATDAENKATCEKNQDCINALTAAINSMPDCTVDGANMRDAFKKSQMSMVEQCKKLGVKVNGAVTVGLSTTVAVAAAAVVLVHA
jgi:hypothetical protein